MMLLRATILPLHWPRIIMLVMLTMMPCVMQAQSNLPLDSPNFTPRQQAMAYHMLADIAWMRGYTHEAIHFYSAALTRQPSVTLAKRTVEIALRYEAFGPAYHAAKFWLALSPNDERAAALYIVLSLKQRAHAELKATIARLRHTTPVYPKALLLAEAELTHEHDADAITHLSRLLMAITSKHAVEYLIIGQLNAKQGKFSAAKQAFEQAITLKPAWDKAVIAYAHFLAHQRHTAQALHILTQTLQREPNRETLRLLRAELMLEQGRIKDAQSELRMLSKSKHTGIEASLLLAHIASSQQRFKAAYTYLQQAHAKAPTDARILYHLGEVCEQLGDTVTAAHWLMHIQTGPYHLPAQIRLIRQQGRLGDVAKALTAIEQLSTQYPHHKKALMITSVQVMVDGKRAPEAMEVLNEALTTQPNNVDYLFARSLVAAHLNDYVSTERDLLEVIRLEPTHVEALNALGFTLANADTNRLSEAMRYIEQALQLSPQNPSVIDSLGWIFYKQKQYQQAIKTLKKALTLSHDGETAAHLGEVLWVSGKKQQAIRVWRDALKRAPQHGLVLDTMRRLSGRKISNIK